MSQSHVTGPNKSNEKTVTVLGNLYGEKIQQLCMDKCVSSCLFYWPEKTGSVTGKKPLTHQVFALKNNHCDVDPPNFTP